MQYKVISFDKLPDFMELVNLSIKEGWKVQGGINTVIFPGGFVPTITYLQAMVKDEKRKERKI